MKRSGVQNLHILIFSLVLSLITIITSCSGGGGGGDSSSSTANNTPSTGQSTLSGTVQADPGDLTASGQNAGATVYVVGQQNNATTTDSNGNFNLNVDPTLSGTVLSSPSFFSRIFQAISSQKTYGLVVLSAGGTHGRKVEVGVTEGQSNPLSTIFINTVGSVSGKALLQDATDHTGTLVYIPGTSFMATTAADGSFKISNVPSGTYDFVRAEKTGTTYHYAVVSNVTVNSNADTRVPDLLLQLSAGANGRVLINNGSSFTTSNTVNLSIATSSNAVLMQISEDPNMAGAGWQPVAATKQYTFSGNYVTGGTATVWMKFADASGLESSPISASIYIDANPLATLVSPVSLTNNSKPTLDWDYSHPILNPKYHVQLAADLSFAVPVIDVSHLTASQYTLTSALPVGTYYWRVAIVDGNGREWNWSYPWSFTVDLNTVSLGAPINRSLVNKAANTVGLNFSWTANPNAVMYLMAVSTQADLSGAATYTVYAPVTNITAAPFAGSSSQVYYWAVTPVDGNGIAGSRSDIWSFTLDTDSPNGSVSINYANPITTRTDVTLNLNATDANQVIHYYASENATLPPSPLWISVLSANSYAADVPFTVPTGSGGKTVYVWFKDTAGNVSNAASDSIQLVQFAHESVEAGGVGQYSSIVAHPTIANSVHISYYDALRGKLKYAFNDSTSGLWTTLTLVASLPTSSFANDNFGMYSSISVLDSGFLNIAYYDATSNNLWRTWGGFGSTMWAAGTNVNSTNGGGEFISMAKDRTTARSHVSFCKNTNGIHGSQVLSYATNTSGLWVTTTVDNSSYVGLYTSLALDSANRAHISYYDGANGNLKHAMQNSDGTWSLSTIDNSANDVGRYTSIAIDTTDHLHISHYDATAGALKYATDASGSWVSTTIDTGHVGMYSAVTVDPSDNSIHITYYDELNGDLKYATNKYGGWGTDVVDASGVVGLFSDIALDPNGTVHVSYYDPINAALKYAHSR